MANWKLTNGDIVPERGMKTTDGVDYVAQLTRNRLLAIKAEWELDRDIGVPWFEILGANYSLDIIQGIVRTIISETRGVDKVGNINLTRDIPNRTVIIDFSAESDGEEFTSKVII